jgi:flagellar biogenesis protein FliO
VVTRALVVVASIVLLAPTAARAETTTPSTNGGYFLREYAEIAAQPAAQPWWALTLDLVVKLGLVVGLIYLTMWALRHFVLGPQARARLAGVAGGKLTLLDTTALAPNRTVYLVEVADRVLVLGATPTTLATLAEIREPEAVQTLRARPVDPASPSFAQQLQHLSAAPTFLQDKIGELRAVTAGFRRPAEET